MVRELKQNLVPANSAPKKIEGKEGAVEKPLRPDQLPIKELKDEWMKKRPRAEIASIERDLGTRVEQDYIEMLESADTEVAGIFTAIRDAFRENGISLEPQTLVGPRDRETRWGKLMIALVGLDRKYGRKKRILCPRLERPVGGHVHGSVVAFEAALNVSALYLKGQYGWDWIPQYTVEPRGVSEDDVKGHDPKIAAAHAAAVEARKPQKQIEKPK